MLTKGANGKSYTNAVGGTNVGVDHPDNNVPMGRWMDGAPIFGALNTIMPPNSPCCRYPATAGGAQAAHTALSWRLMPPTSFHPGGINGAMLDSSVRFFPDNINSATTNPATPQNPVDLNSPKYQANTANGIAAGTAIYPTSPFGVWGALGSIAGGESVSL
jgi:hypothetical protein